MRSFCRKNPVHKIPRFRGGGVFWVLGGGGSADSIFMGARIFLTQGPFAALPCGTSRSAPDKAATFEILFPVLCYRAENPNIGNASLFTKFLFTIFVPFDPPPPNQQNEGFPLEFLLNGPQTELRTLSQN